MAPVETHLITGFPGAGKSTLLRAMLAQRPPAEHWALLLNASGGIEPVADVAVAQVTDGCACCSARVSFRVALVQLLRSAKPHRLWIELAGVGDPAGVCAVLAEDSLARVLTLRSSLCVVQPRHLGNTDITSHETYLAQLHHADHVVIAANPAQHPSATVAALARLGVAEDRISGMHDAGLALLSPNANDYSNDNSRRISS
jgi:G3E family GTPase